MDKKQSSFVGKAVLLTGVILCIPILILIFNLALFMHDISSRNSVLHAKEQMGVFILGLREFRDANDRFPQSEDELLAFLAKDRNMNWPIDFFDLWHTKMQFIKNGNKIEIISAGPDKIFHTVDDISVMLDDVKTR